MVRMILRIALALWLVCAPALSRPARADPASLTYAVVSFLAADLALGVNAAVAITSVLTTLGIPALLTGASLLLAPKQPSIDPGEARETFESAAAPELRAVGRVRLGGLKVYGNTADDDRYRLIAHCKGEIDGWELFFLQGFEVVLAPDGGVNSYPWKDGGTTFAFVDTKDGTGSETAWSDLTTAFPNHWTSSHRVRGVAQSLIRFVNPGFGDEKFLELYQGGVPDLEVVVRAEKSVYDPRSESSQWTVNGILNAQHILLSYSEFTLDNIDQDFISDEADRADDLIDTKDGTIPRAQCCGVWSSEIPRGDNFSKVLDSIGAWVVPRGGGFTLGLQLIDDNPDSEVTIPLRHILSIDWRSGPQGVERPNLCRLKYYSPERNYELAEIDLSGIAWARNDDEIEAYGEKPMDIELPFCPASGQAQRRARQMFLLARSDTGVIKTNMAGLAVWGCRVVSFEFPDDLGTIKCLIGSPKVLDDEGAVEIPFVVWPELTDWSVDEDEADAPEQVPDITLGTALSAPSAPLEATVVQYQGGLGYHTRVRYTVPGDAEELEVAYRTIDDGNPSQWRPMTEYGGGFETGVKHAYTALDLSGEHVEFRFRTFNEGDSRSSVWSPPLVVSELEIENDAPSAPSISVDVDGSDITVTVTAPNSFNVAYLTLTGASAPGVNAIKPGEVISWQATGLPPGTYNYTAKAHSSNGTASATASDSGIVT